MSPFVEILFVDMRSRIPAFFFFFSMNWEKGRTQHFLLEIRSCDAWHWRIGVVFICSLFIQIIPSLSSQDVDSLLIELVLIRDSGLSLFPYSFLLISCSYLFALGMFDWYLTTKTEVG